MWYLGWRVEWLFSGEPTLRERFLQTYLPKIKVTELEATYLMWLDVSAAVPDVARLQAALVSVGKVAIMDGSIYGGNGQRFYG